MTVDARFVKANLRRLSNDWNRNGDCLSLECRVSVPIASCSRKSSFFQQIGRADELGSGMRKLTKYGRAYGGADPELIEGDVFRMIVKVPAFDDAGKTGSFLAGTTQEATQETTQETQNTTQEKIVRIIRLTPAITGKELASKVGMTEDGIKYHLNKMKKAGLLRHVGPTKAGHWEILNGNERKP